MSFRAGPTGFPSQRPDVPLRYYQFRDYN